MQLPAELTDNLLSINPWWRNEAGATVPPFRRWPFARLRRLLSSGIAPATVLRGPRRVGKTVLLKQIIQSCLDEGVDPKRLLYVPFDELPTLGGLQEPVLSIARWYERQVLGATFNTSGRQGTPALLFLDEVQNLKAWAPQIKNLVDNHAVRVLLTGSSSFRIEAGRDSLAGRITTLDLGPLLLREIAELRLGRSTTSYWSDNGHEGVGSAGFWREAVELAEREAEARRESFRVFSERGAYPVAHMQAAAGWAEIADHLNESVIQKVIRHDLRAGTRAKTRDQRLLEEVFRLCCRYAGQTPDLNPAGRAAERLESDTLLIRLIEPLELRLKRRKSPSKVCLCDHALRASWLQEIVPLDPDGLAANPHLSDLAGHLAESTLGYFLASIPHLDVAHFPARGLEPEVDFVVTIGTRRIPIEVKYRRRIDPHEDTRGLRAFLEKTVYNAPFGLLVTLDDGVTVADPRIIPISLSALLWMR